MEYIQLIMVMCSLVSEPEECENYYWDCLMRGHRVWDCIVNSPYKIEQNGEGGILKDDDDDEVSWPTPITGTYSND